MIQLLFFDHLPSKQRRPALLMATFFITAEALSLGLLSAHFHFAYLLGIVAAFGAGALLRPGSSDSAAEPFRSVAIFDAILYAVALFGTVVLLWVPSAQPIPSGFSTRLDLELFAAALGVLVAAICWPVAGDSYAFRHPMTEDPIRETDWVPAIPAGCRRFTTSIVAVAILGIAALLFLRASHGLVTSILIILVAWVFMAFAFELVYGYRSFILRFVGTSLFGLVIFGLLRHTHPLDLLPIIAVRAMAGIWLMFWVRSIGEIFRNTQQRYLAKRQVISHVGYIVTLGLGHCLIYGLWIDPVAVPSPLK